jgi:hypothetical protein
MGGLMRCCTQTLDELPPDGNYVERMVVPCKHCSGSMILVDKVWKWNH